MRTAIKDLIHFTKLNGDNDKKIIAIINQYVSIYNNFAEIQDDFLTFSIKFKYYLNINNIDINYVNDNKVRKYIKQRDLFIKKDCIKFLNLIDNYDTNHKLVINEEDFNKIFGIYFSRIRRKSINVIISAYDTEEFIEECLDSVNEQTYRAKKILLGIDGCEKTLAKVLKIREKYNNLSIYNTEKNQGVYKMFNALIELVPDDEYLIFFGADDVMHPNMLEEMSRYDNPTISRHSGVLFIKKETLKNKVGGFRNWKCSADTDMVIRLKLAYKKRITHAPQFFFRRVHDKQLTSRPETALGSKLRKNYSRIYENNELSENPIIFVEPVCSKITMIS